MKDIAKFIKCKVRKRKVLKFSAKQINKHLNVLKERRKCREVYAYNTNTTTIVPLLPQSCLSRNLSLISTAHLWITPLTRPNPRE